MPAQKLLPGGLPAALGCRFQTVLPKNVGDGAARDLVAQIGQRTLYSPVAPIPVLGGHAHHQLLDVILRARSSRATPLAAIIFPGNQLTVPSQEGLRRDQ